MHEIICDNHSPITRYSKTFANAYVYASLIGTLAISFSKDNTPLNQSLLRTHSDYTTLNRFENIKLFYKRAKPGIIAFAVFATVFRFMGDKLV